MTAHKVLLAAVLATFIMIHTVDSKASPGTGTKVSELNSQIVQEVREVLKTPYLKFSSENLTGKVKVITQVRKDGKIIFKNIQGVNENLVSNVIDKLNSLNLWTSTDYSNREFIYEIKYKD